jgi:hypothetical protein
MQNKIVFNVRERREREGGRGSATFLKADLEQAHASGPLLQTS